MVLLVLMWGLVSVFSLGLFIIQPMALGVGLLVGSVLVCGVIGLEISSLLGLLLFLIYVSGVMVLFLYVLSIYPNEVYYSQFFTFFLLSFCCGAAVVFAMLECESSKVESPLSWGFTSGVDGVILYVFAGLILLLGVLIVSYLCMKSCVPLRKTE